MYHDGWHLSLHLCHKTPVAIFAQLFPFFGRSYSPSPGSQALLHCKQVAKVPTRGMEMERQRVVLI